ncbi:MAG TPA: hypothetical protein EYN03_08790, partial [Planctomycetes bacterium]|nr:hypothetical protein [Planctomycetota bacterium]
MVPNPVALTVRRRAEMSLHQTTTWSTSTMRYWQPLCIVLAIFATDARAHDLWLLPDTKPTVGDQLIVLARQGMDFPNSTKALSTDKFSHRIVIG